MPCTFLDVDAGGGDSGVAGGGDDACDRSCVAAGEGADAGGGDCSAAGGGVDAEGREAGVDGGRGFSSDDMSELITCSSLSMQEVIGEGA